MITPGLMSLLGMTVDLPLGFEENTEPLTLLGALEGSLQLSRAAEKPTLVGGPWFALPLSQEDMSKWKQALA